MPTSWRPPSEPRRTASTPISGRTTSRASRARGPADHRCVDRRGRTRTRDPAHRAWRPRVTGDVPPPGHLREGRDDRDEMSGGRIEVGVGAGWNALEHEQLGLAFPPIKERADLMEDQLAILHGLWGEPDGWSYDGITGNPTRGRDLPAASGRRRGPAADAHRWGSAQDHRGRPGLTPFVPPRRALRGRVQPEFVVARQGDRGEPGPRRSVSGDRSRALDAGALDDGGRAGRS